MNKSAFLLLSELVIVRFAISEQIQVYLYVSALIVKHIFRLLP